MTNCNWYRGMTRINQESRQTKQGDRNGPPMQARYETDRENPLPGKTVSPTSTESLPVHGLAGSQTRNCCPRLTPTMTTSARSTDHTGAKGFI
jgi:hypothetical protein